MTPSEQVKKSVEQFESWFCMQTIIPDIEGQNTIRQHLITSQVALLESVVSGLEEGVAAYKKEKPKNYYALGKQVGRITVLQDQITFLTEQINKIKGLL